MKGIVFTEFLDMVEAEFGLETADKIIMDSKLASNGAYTAIGTYDHNEMGQLVTNLSKITGESVPNLLSAFGQYLFGRFVKGFPQFFTNVKGTFPFLLEIENHIHVEVKKLYPDAELPSFDTVLKGNQLSMVYKSERRLSDLAEGLILGCIAYFNEKITVNKEDLSNGDGKIINFILTKVE